MYCPVRWSFPRKSWGFARWRSALRYDAKGWHEEDFLNAQTMRRDQSPCRVLVRLLLALRWLFPAYPPRSHACTAVLAVCCSLPQPRGCSDTLRTRQVYYARDVAQLCRGECGVMP